MERNVLRDPGAMAELQNLGFLAVPVTVIDGKAIPGFRPDLVKQALGLTAGPAPRELTEVISLLNRALPAVARAISQMPDEKFTWEAPDRPRPMAEFAYHIPAAVANVASGIDTRKYGPVDPTPWANFKTFAEIAQYGERVAADFKTWIVTHDLSELRTRAPEGSDNRIPTQRLDQMAGHTIHHLRQLYWVLREFGIDPKDPIPDIEFPPEYVLPITNKTGGFL